METRARTLERVLTLVRPGGVLVLDDAHKQGYNSYARGLLTARGIPHFSARAYTLDPDGRYAMVRVPL